MLFTQLPTELLSIILLGSAFNVGKAYGGPSVNVALQASFSEPPYLLELLETATEENSTAYFPLVDTIAAGRFAECSTDRELYEEFLKVLKDQGHIVNDDALSSFQLALSIHSAAPRIEAHYQYYDTLIEPSLMAAQDAACPVWVQFDGKQYCTPALDRAQQDLRNVKSPDVLPFDRVLDTSTGHRAGESILYADITSPLFGHFHQTISGTAKRGDTTYRIRYRPQPSEFRKPLRVNGYGVELALKRTDYIVIDDRNAENEAEDEEEIAGDTMTGGAVNEGPLLEDSDEDMPDLKPLSAKELSGIGLKTASFIMASKDPLATLAKVSLDFPKFSAALSKRNATKEVVSEHRKNRDVFLPAGYNVIWMNGQQVQSREIDAFALLQQIRRERRIVDNLRAIGFTGSEAVKVLSHSAISDSKTGENSQRYDYRDETEGGRVIIWLNDIENDKRYNNWPKDLSALLQRTWPGQLPQVRRDIHNVVVPVDLTDTKDIEVVVEQLQTVVKRRIPIRFGIVPLVVTPAMMDQAKIVYHLWDAYGLAALLSYLELLLKSKAPTANIKDAFDVTVKERRLRQNRQAFEYQQVLKEDSDHGDKNATDAEADANSNTKPGGIINTQQYLKRLGAEALPAPFFTNGAAMVRNDNWLSTMSTRIDSDLRNLQRLVFEGDLPEETWLAGQLIDKAAKQRNALIVPEDESSISILNMGSLLKDYEGIYQKLPSISPQPDIVRLDRLAPHLLVVADIESAEGIALLKEAVRFQQSNGEVELVFVHNPTVTSRAAISINLAHRLQKDSSLSAVDLEMVLAANTSITFPKEDVEHSEQFWGAYQPFLKDVRIEPGQRALILNGRRVGPIPPSTAFVLSDFDMLLQYERSERIEPVQRAISAMGLHEKITVPIESAILTSNVALSSISDIPEGIFDSAPTLRMDRFQAWAGQHTMIETGQPDASSVHIVASIDPTSQIAQRWIAILQVLAKLDGVYMKLYLNPREKLQELPIKRFYRQVLEAKPSFTEDGRRQERGAQFNGMPREALLNLALDVPPAWLVAAKESIHDLDNIKISALREGSNVDALYELESILIEGHSRDVTVGTPPRGVQLFLGTEKDPHFADTIIMANLGYFQFKVNPGFWNLKLQAGRSSEIFNIDSAGPDGWNPAPGDEHTHITLMSFQGKTLYPRLSRKPGQEEEDVLEEGGTSILSGGGPNSYINKASKIASSFLHKAGFAPATTQHAEINIFSVASGHLYERMLSIMIVSVMRHTKQSVKFWFIAQFLSPSFKASLPTLAAHYNFKFELVTYKWPHWLRQQSEKQREIWGYKILFLDVLFPTSLNKVIFVDADQIVRTDMNELNHLDLEGAPYGFTPMCDSRTEMEGYRFWKTGYWANFLRGLPYHISALYVVDLVKFREIAAGDRLRGQYHQLSADPASLSNLDQDLPNHMQHVLKIKSLPQDWLWCETWCSDEALKSAKTIDLCNNPETKEPKLKRARRQVPEWTVYDDEIAEVLRTAESTGGEVRGGVQEDMIEGTAQSERPEDVESGKASDSRDGDARESESHKKERDEL